MEIANRGERCQEPRQGTMELGGEDELRLAKRGDYGEKAFESIIRRIRKNQ
jgi:hypothetical protein